MSAPRSTWRSSRRPPVSKYDPAKGDKTQADFGKRVFDARGCATCHSLDGSAKTGPSFKGLYGKTESIVGGSTVTVEDNYIRESVLQPNAKVVQGFSPQMPSFAGQLDDKQITALIEFIKAQEVGTRSLPCPRSLLAPPPIRSTRIARRHYLRAKTGLMSWLVTVDHKRLGVMYGIAVLFFFLIAGLLAILCTELSRRIRTS